MRSPGPPFVGITKVYGRRGPMQQYRLASAISFRCVRCGGVKTSKLIATYGDDPNRRLCNGCYGRLLSLHEIKAGTMPDDLKAEALSDLLLSLVSDAEARDAARRGQLRDGFEATLNPLATRFLGTSIYVADSLDDLDLDWSAAVLGLCKALEVELVSRFIDPLRAAAQSTLEADRLDPDLKRLVAYLTEPERRRSPDMGSVAQFLLAASHSESRATASAIITAFRARLARLPGHLWVTSGAASAAITAITRQFRNPASHTGVLSRAEFEGCRTAVVGTEGILWTLVDATSSGR